MKTLTHKYSRSGAGFTLMETSAAMAVLVVLSVAMVVMLQQHLSFMTLTTRQAFLTNEAPKIGNVLGRIFNQADHYFVYDSRASALAGAAPVLTDGRAVRLFFKSAAQQTVERTIAVETTGGATSLRFYTPQANGTQTSWVICNSLTGANFHTDEGILSVTLQGPNGEEVTYSGGGL
jgi:hypothetical protein